MEIRVVTKSDCPFCDMAKKWFDENGFEYTAEVIDNEEERLAFYQSINGINEIVGKPNDVRRVNSVPQIFVDDERIGGYDQLMQYAETLFKKRGARICWLFLHTGNHRVGYTPARQLCSEHSKCKWC